MGKQKDKKKSIKKTKEDKVKRRDHERERSSEKEKNIEVNESAFNIQFNEFYKNFTTAKYTLISLNKKFEACEQFLKTCLSNSNNKKIGSPKADKYNTLLSSRKDFPVINLNNDKKDDGNLTISLEDIKMIELNYNSEEGSDDNESIKGNKRSTTQNKRGREKEKNASEKIQTIEKKPKSTSRSNLNKPTSNSNSNSNTNTNINIDKVISEKKSKINKNLDFNNDDFSVDNNPHEKSPIIKEKEDKLFDTTANNYKEKLFDYKNFDQSKIKSQDKKESFPVSGSKPAPNTEDSGKWILKDNEEKKVDDITLPSSHVLKKHPYQSLSSGSNILLSNNEADKIDLSLILESGKSSQTQKEKKEKVYEFKNQEDLQPNPNKKETKFSEFLKMKKEYKNKINQEKKAPSEKNERPESVNSGSEKKRKESKFDFNKK
jgi:hypothetical protein